MDTWVLDKRSLVKCEINEYDRRSRFATYIMRCGFSTKSDVIKKTL